MSESEKTVVEVNGVKLEVDLRYARRIDTLRIGDRVKCLVKGYGGTMNTYPGVVVGFEPFPSLPSIVIAYLDTSAYNGEVLKVKTFNAKTEDFEAVADNDCNSLEVNKSRVLSLLERDIEKKRQELNEAELRREYFLSNFGSFFEDH